MSANPPAPRTRGRPRKRRAGRRRRPPQSIAAAAVGSERILNQDEIDSLLGLRRWTRKTAPSAPASARSSIRRWFPTSACRCSRSCSTAWCGLMTTSLRNFTSDNVEVSPRHHLVHPLRRLSQLDSAAGHSRGVPRQAARQFRPADGRFEPDLFDRRRAARRPPRHRRHARRGPALHHHRARAGARAWSRSCCTMRARPSSR